MQKNCLFDRKKFAIPDFILISIIIFCIVFSSFSFFSNKPALTALVNQNGKEIARFELNEINHSFEYTVDGDYPLTLLLGSDGVSVLNADCPDKLCIHSGKLTKNGDVAVCLPARVTVILTGSDDNNIDGVVR